LILFGISTTLPARPFALSLFFSLARTNKKIILWDGFCYVHHCHIQPEDIKQDVRTAAA